MPAQIKDIIGVQELTKKGSNIWKELVAEFLGNVLLNFFGCAAVVRVHDPSMPINPVLIALTFGFVVFTVVTTIGHVSGGHINPAVTVGMLSTGRISLIKAIFYVVAQCVGALAGSAILKAFTPEEAQGSLGLTSLGPHVTLLQGTGIEFFLAMLLVLVVFGVCDENRLENKAVGPLAIGVAVAIGHLAGIGYTGSAMNPARAFGSAVIANEWEDHWVYWVGPCLGGIAGALLYTHLFSAPKIVERYIAVETEDKELKRLDRNKSDEGKV